jgi:cytochrome c-type biogenesis protein CcmH/NrfG
VRDAYAALQRKDYEASREASLKVLALDPRNQYALSYLGHACQMLGEFPRAEEAYRNLIAINPAARTARSPLREITYADTPIRRSRLCPGVSSGTRAALSRAA